MRLTDFSILSFDCYGTLIDWETGIWAALQPLLGPAPHTGRDAALAAFARVETELEAEAPALRYCELLAEVHRRLAAEWGIAAGEPAHRAFGNSVPDWPAFPDSAAALLYLKQHYRLVILSNVDRTGFAGSNERLQVAFDAVYTAEEIGSYKPDPRNFRHMLDALGYSGGTAGDLLHVAQSLFHDHAPARALGLATAWIDRRQDRLGWGATPPPPGPVACDFRFASLEAMVAAHREELRARDGSAT
jgi:2-haloacid dehalogenase